MGSFLLQRLLHLFGVLILVLIIVSILLRLVPGDPVDAIMAGNPGITEADKAALREQLGLTKPIFVQVTEYAGGLVRGDFGQSLRFRSEVRPLILEKLPPTIELRSPVPAPRSRTRISASRPKGALSSAAP